MYHTKSRLTKTALSVEEGAAAADVATAADDNADSSSSSTGDAIPVPSGSKENLIALFSYAGPMEKVPYLQDAVYVLLHDFCTWRLVHFLVVRPT